MMTTTEATALRAMKLALEALEWEEAQTFYPSRMTTNAITALRQALANEVSNEALDRMAENARELGLMPYDGGDYEPAQQEPVAWVDERAIAWLADRLGKTSAHITTKLSAAKSFERPMPLYTTPSQRTWVNATTWRGLTDEDKEFIAKRASVYDWHDYEVIEATEAKLKEKNCG